MPIKIMDGPDIHITRAEMERLLPEWEASQRMTTRPVSFETWVRNHRHSPEERSDRSQIQRS